VCCSELQCVAVCCSVLQCRILILSHSIAKEKDGAGLGGEGGRGGGGVPGV